MIDLELIARNFDHDANECDRNFQRCGLTGSVATKCRAYAAINREAAAALRQPGIDEHAALVEIETACRKFLEVA